ncbi:MAG: ribosomal-processing cysteine protease Prp [Oscillospiraceae bacterium]|nr:ribosomal-processing cysteine protease Prp [Oscillospiraceae bacterium]
MKLTASFTQKNGMLISCKVKGHAEYTEEDPRGQILCAAVSSAVQLTCNTLTECFGAAVTVTEQPSASAQNTLGFRLDAPDPVQSELLHGLLIHMQALSEDFDGLLTVTLKQC